MAAPAEGSRAKYVRELLDKAVGLPAPQLSPEDFEREFSMRVTAEEIKNLTLAEVMIRQLVLKAAKGNDKSITDVMDRLLGKPTQTTENVSKTYNYHDFLVECRNADAAEVGKVVVESVARSIPETRRLTAPMPVPPLEDELLKDFLDDEPEDPEDMFG
jgi:hypothetical protein